MKTRRRFTAEFKAKVALEAIRGERTIRNWRRSTSFTQPYYAVETAGHREFGQGARRRMRGWAGEAEVTKLHVKIGQLVVERNTLAKAFDRWDWIGGE